MLWDANKNLVWVDTNQNNSFADQTAMTDYRVNYDVGFFGVDVYTRVHTPRFWGQPWSAGAVFLRRCFSRLSRTN